MPSQPTPIELDNLHRGAATPKLLSELVTDMVNSEPKKKPPTWVSIRIASEAFSACDQADQGHDIPSSYLRHLALSLVRAQKNYSTLFIASY